MAAPAPTDIITFRTTDALDRSTHRKELAACEVTVEELKRWIMSTIMRNEWHEKWKLILNVQGKGMIVVNNEDDIKDGLKSLGPVIEVGVQLMGAVPSFYPNARLVNGAACCNIL